MATQAHTSTGGVAYERGDENWQQLPQIAVINADREYRLQGVQ